MDVVRVEPKISPPTALCVAHGLAVDQGGGAVFPGDIGRALTTVRAWDFRALIPETEKPVRVALVTIEIEDADETNFNFRPRFVVSTPTHGVSRRVGESYVFAMQHALRVVDDLEHYFQKVGPWHKAELADLWTTKE